MSDNPKPHPGLGGYLRAFARMLRAMGRKEYRRFPVRTAAIIILAAGYFLFPFDLIIDALPFFGFIDDAAVFGLVIASVKRDIDKFLEWESKPNP